MHIVHVTTSSLYCVFQDIETMATQIGASTNNGEHYEFQVLGTEVAFVQSRVGLTKNLNRMTLQELYTTFFPWKYTEGIPQNMDNEKHRLKRELFFGTHGLEKWKYVYFSEFDTLIHMRQRMTSTALNSFHHMLDQGKIFIPHRLNPIPHQS